MKKLFRGAVPTIALLLVAVMSLTSLTYAWFTAGDTATVETVTVDVKSVEGLLVSANGVNGSWGSTMKPLYYTAANGSATSATPDKKYLTLRDISTVGDLVTGTNQIKFFSVEYDNVFDAIVSSVQEETIVPSEKDYANWVAFDVYMKNEGGTGFTINLAESVLNATALTRAVARVAVVNDGTASSKVVLSDDAQPTITGTPTLVKIWEPNKGDHTADGSAWLTANGISANQSTGAIDYYGVKSAFAKVAGTYYNRAENGNEYKIYSTAALTLNEGAVPTPGEGKYYVYTEDADHFRELKLDDFYKVANQQTVAQAVAAAEKDADTTYFKKDGDSYVVLKGKETLEQGKVYYQAAVVGGTTSPDVLVYTMTVNNAKDKLAPITTLVYDPTNIEVTLGSQTITKLTIYIWFEGQDCDCTNSVAGNNFTLDLKFKKKAAASN